MEKQKRDRSITPNRRGASWIERYETIGTAQPAHSHSMQYGAELGAATVLVMDVAVRPEASR